MKLSCLSIAPLSLLLLACVPEGDAEPPDNERRTEVDVDCPEGFDKVCPADGCEADCTCVEQIDCPPVDVDCPEGFDKVCPADGCEADCTCVEQIDCPPVDVDCPEGFDKVCPADGCEADCTCVEQTEVCLLQSTAG